MFWARGETSAPQTAPPSAAPVPSVSPYEIRVEHLPGLTRLQLTTNDGKITAYFPEGIREGEAFSGTIEMDGFVSSTAALDYAMTFAGQTVKVKDGTFHWKLPENSDSYMHLRFADYRGDERAATQLMILRNYQSREPALPGGDRLHLPEMIQAGSPTPVFGPFDGNSSTTHVQIGGQECRVLAEMPGKAIVMSPANVVGMTTYSIQKAALEGKGETRVLRIVHSLKPIEQRNGATGKWSVQVAGLQGVKDDVPLKFEIGLPRPGLFEATPPYSYFISSEQWRFIEPKEIRKDGTFAAERTIERIVEGPLDATAALAVPQDMHELVEVVLRSPRHNWSVLPAVEYAAALKPYGDPALQALSEFLTGPEGLAYEALTTLFQSPEYGAQWVVPHLREMNGQPLQMALDTYTGMATTVPDFKYRKDLRAAIVDWVTGGRSVEAVYSLAKLGTAEDIPLLENTYEFAKNSPGYQKTADACEAALARFGVKEHIDSLAKKVATPGEFWTKDVQRAVFADRPELIPALCQHIHDPGHWYGDYGVYPGQTALQAILAIVHKPDADVEGLCKK